MGILKSSIYKEFYKIKALVQKLIVNKKGLFVKISEICILYASKNKRHSEKI